MGKKIIVNCKVCNKEITRWKRYNKKVDKHYCAKHLPQFYLNTIIHENKSNPKNREKNGQWKGGVNKRQDGYLRITIESGTRQLYHRYLLEKHLGIKLKPSQVVHHVNGDNTDNRLENLLIVSQQEHTKLHNFGQCLHK